MLNKFQKFNLFAAGFCLFAAGLAFGDGKIGWGLWDLLLAFLNTTICFTIGREMNS